MDIAQVTIQLKEQKKYKKVIHHAIIGSFYYEHVFKLPRQKGLLFMQPDWASALS